MQKPVGKISIVTEKNVSIISVDKAIPAPMLYKAALSHNDLQSRDMKQLYKNAKKIFRAENRVTKGTAKVSKFYYVPRDSMPLAITPGIDNTQKICFLKPHKNYGCFFNMRYVFRTNDSLHLLDHKRWIYPRTSTITVHDKNIRVSRYEPAEQGTFKMTISPGIQLYGLRKDTGHYNNAGVIGIEIGAEYFYQENRFLSFNMGASVVSPLSPDAMYDSTCLRETGGAIYTGVRDNFIKGIFDVGYGLSFARLFWTKAPYYNSTNLPTSKISTTGLGLSFSAHIKLMQGFKAGVLYYPNLLNINRAPTFQYQHYLTFHIA